jgi:gentisate 1,2-dioxygenase
VALNSQQRNLHRGDVIVVPAWTEFALQASSQLDVFTFSVAPVFEKLGLLHSEIVS